MKLESTSSSPSDILIVTLLSPISLNSGTPVKIVSFITFSQSGFSGTEYVTVSPGSTSIALMVNVYVCFSYASVRSEVKLYSGGSFMPVTSTGKA